MPDQMTEADKDKDLEAVRPPVEAGVNEENTSQSPNGGVNSEESSELSPREEIYKKHDEVHRPVTAPDEVAKGYLEEEQDLSLVAEEEQPEEPTLEAVKPNKKKPGPKPQVDVTINGVTRKVDKAKVDAAGGIEAYQMMVAGQEKLRIAAQREKEIEAREAEIARREKEFKERTLNPKVEDAPITPDLATPVEDRQSELLKRADEALLDGDVEESARLKALANQEIREAAKKEATEAAVQHVEQTQRERDERQQSAERKKAIETGTAHFAIEFPEIMADRNLLSMADNETIEIARDNPDWTPSEVMHQAGVNVTEWVKKQVGEPEPAAPSSLESKANEKRSMRSPKGGSGRAPRKPEPQQPTKSDYVLELQRMRGQA